MKKMKKLLGVLLTVIMVLVMAAPSFADPVTSTPLTPATPNPWSEGDEGNGKITIDNPILAQEKNDDGTLKYDENGQPVRGTDEATYTAYQIFEVTYSGPNYSYRILANSPWFGTVAKSEDGKYVSNVTGLTLNKSASQENSGGSNVDVYYITVGEDFKAADFAGQLKSALENMPANSKPTGKELKAVEGEEGIVADDLPLGYYFVTTTSGVLCNLTTTNPEITIHDKNDAPTIDKDIVQDVEEGQEKDYSVKVGDTVTYQITGHVPNTTGYDKYTYKISDTMSEGLTFNKNSVTVKVAGKDYTIPRRDLLQVKNNGFELTLDVMSEAFSYNDEIVVTYTAVVNQAAANGTDPEKNTANLTYSNNPSDSTSTITTPGVVVEVYTSNIIIDKYRKDAPAVKLKGATFVLQNSSDANAKYYKYTEPKAATNDSPAVEAKVEWVDKESDATPIVTDEQGAAKILGLKDGTYYLKETEAPTGYNRLTELVSVEINGKKHKEDKKDENGNIITDSDGNPVQEEVQRLSYTRKIENNTGSILPSTGGIGTTIFYAVGIILMAGAVFFVVRRRRA